MLKKLTATGIVTVTAAGAMMVATPAFADFTGNTTSGKHSILGGNQVNVPINVPITIACNGIGVIGIGVARC